MRKAIVHQEFAPDQGVLSFYTYEVLTKLLHDLVAAYPTLAEIASIGKSLEGRDLWLVTVTNKQTGPALEKPAYWIDGNTHAGEVTGSTVVLYTLWSYLTNILLNGPRKARSAAPAPILFPSPRRGPRRNSGACIPIFPAS
jgi:murein tripeptide amidase MpaA